VNTAAAAYLGSCLYFDERPDEAAISNRAPIKVNWLDDGNVLIKLHIDNPSMPDFRPHQGGLLTGQSWLVR
jgi:hypothetical protein